MQNVIEFLKQASSTLNRASGLSSSFLKAACTLDELAQQQDLFAKLEDQFPLNATQGTHLRKAAVSLYNAAQKGGSNQVSLLRLRALSCDAMRASGHVLDVNEEGKLLETMKCYAKTGKLLVGVSEMELARRCLLRALDVAQRCTSGLTSMIVKVNGKTQAAQDTALLYFQALCCLTELDLDSAIAKDHAQSTVLNSALDRLKTNLDFIRSANSKQQLILRRIIDDGCSRLSFQESIPFQQTLVEDWEDFSSSTPTWNQMAAARLAYSLSLAESSPVGAISALERAESFAASESLEATTFLHLARCAVKVARARHESFMRDLVASSNSGDCTLERSAEDLVNEATQAFTSLVHGGGFMFETSHEPLFRATLELSDHLAQITTSFEQSYGRLISACEKADWIASILIHAARKQGELTRAWLMADHQASHKVMAMISSSSNSKQHSVSTALWNGLCVAQSKDEWEVVLNISKLLQVLAPSSPEMHSRALVAEAFAMLHLELPQRDGALAEEAKILAQVGKVAVQAKELATCQETLQAATIIELRCLVRCRQVDHCVQLDELISTCKDRIASNQLKLEGLVELADDAFDVNAYDTSIGLLCLAREQASNIQTLELVLPRLVKARLESDQVFELSQDVARWKKETCTIVHSAPEMRETIAAMGLHVRSLLVPAISKRAKQEPGSLLEAFYISCLLWTVSATLEEDSEQEEVLLAASGILLEASLHSIRNEQPSCGSETQSLLALSGERITSMLAKLPTRSRKNESKVAPYFMCGSILMAYGVEDADVDLRSQLTDVFRSGEYGDISVEGLYCAALLAKKLEFGETARELMVRVLQLSLLQSPPNYEHILRKCMPRLIQDGESKSDLLGFVSQAECCRLASNQNNADVLERLSLALVRALRRFDCPELLKQAGNWLKQACDSDGEIKERRQALLLNLQGNC